MISVSSITRVRLYERNRFFLDNGESFARTDCYDQRRALFTDLKRRFSIVTGRRYQVKRKVLRFSMVTGGRYKVKRVIILEPIFPHSTEGAIGGKKN